MYSGFIKVCKIWHLTGFECPVTACASIDVAKVRAKEIGDDFVLNRGSSPVECLKRTLETLEATTAAGLKVVLKTAGFMIRVTPKPDINDGWGK